ncbi:uncharacterized protein [Rutidosis leptorrhynchoides]|uniref:uncharacterized protein n=1 Tax=Rutidosis leptorrhynchoides TaxID=125765 RepID=UPI003A9A38D4
MRPAGEALLVIATWLCLEEMGYSNIFETLIQKDLHTLSCITEEATSILNCLQFKPVKPVLLGNDGVLILTTNLTSKLLTIRMISLNSSFQAIKDDEWSNENDDRIWRWNPALGVCADDRTMFLTFSKGFPVIEEELRELFTKKFGDCIDKVEMQKTNDNQQTLFAKLVLHSTITIDLILMDEPKAKFKINKKHVWARKYDRRGRH